MIEFISLKTKPAPVEGQQPLSLNESSTSFVIQHWTYHHEHMADVYMVKPFVQTNLKNKKECSYSTNQHSQQYLLAPHTFFSQVDKARKSKYYNGHTVGSMDKHKLEVQGDQWQDQKSK